MRSASALLSLLRWQNALIAAGGVLLGAWWAVREPFSSATVAAALAAVALTGFANTLNDLHDRDIDATAHPRRPLPRGDIEPAIAVRFAMICGGAGVLLSAAAHAALGVLSLGVVALMAAYNWWLKPAGLAGNITVAVLASLPFLYGAWSVGRPQAAWMLLALAIPLHMAREIAKDLEDAGADAATRATLPVRFGARGARGALIAALLVFVAALVPFALSRPAFALLVAPALVICVVAAWIAFVGRRGSPLLLKTAMVWSMIALVAGAS